MLQVPFLHQVKTTFLDFLVWPLGLIFLTVLTLDFYIAINITVDIFSGSTPDYKSAIAALGPPTIGIGVFVAWVSFLSNQHHKQNDVSRKTSSFFYNECTRKLDKVVSTLSYQASNDNWMHNIRTNLDDVDLKTIVSELTDVQVLWCHISHGAYQQAFSIRWRDMHKLILQKLRSQSLEDCIRLHWGGDLITIDERIDSYNQSLKESLQKTDASKRSWNLANAEPRDEYTPFPNGLSSIALKKLISIIAVPIDKAGETDENAVNLYIEINNLDILKKYFYACSSYRLENGFILRNEKHRGSGV